MLNIYLNGKECDIVEWEDIQVSATFDNGVKPNISIDEFTFVGRSIKIINEWTSEHGYFQGLPFKITYTDSSQLTYDFFYGCLDFYAGFDIINPYKYKIKIKQTDNLNYFDDRIKALSFGYLVSEGKFFNSDYTKIPVKVKKKFDATEVALVSLSLYVITNDIYRNYKEDKEFIISKTEILLSTPTQKPAVIFKLIATILIFILFKALMLIALLNMLKVISQNLLPRLTKYKAITLRRALEKACAYLGYTFVSSIPELDYYNYLPSKQDDKIKNNKKDEGIPNPSDYGYIISEMFDLCKKLFFAKVNIYTNQQGVIICQLEAESNEIFQRQSGYILPDVLTETYRPNIQDLSANTFITFQYDFSDEYTMPNSRATAFDSKDKNNEKIELEKGISYEVIVDLANSPTDVQTKLIKGFDEVNIPMALGTRADKLSALEQGLKVLFFTADILIKLFGGKTFAEKINQHKGSLLISAPSFNTPKLICLVNGVIPSNHRDLLSAKTLFDKYHWYKSFYRNPSKAQRLIFENIRVPFIFNNFITTSKNSYFTTIDGKRGKFLSYNWNIGDDSAIASYYIESEYEKNLKETTIEV